MTLAATLAVATVDQTSALTTYPTSAEATYDWSTFLLLVIPVLIIIVVLVLCVTGVFMFCLSTLTLNYDSDVTEGTGSMTIPERKISLPKSQLWLHYKGTLPELPLSETVKLKAEDSSSDMIEDRFSKEAEVTLEEVGFTQRENDSISVKLESGEEIKEVRIELEPCKHLVEIPSLNRGTLHPSVHPDPDVSGMKEMMTTLENMRCQVLAVPAMPPHLKLEYFRPQNSLCAVETAGVRG